MIKQLMASVLALVAAVAFGAVDVNKADQAALESVKGIGPGISSKILDERKKGQFKDWSDLIERVKGVGEGNAAKYSAEGLTVNGTTYKATVAPAKKEDKPIARKEETKPTPTAATTAPAKKEEMKPAPTAPPAAPGKVEKAAAAAAPASAAKK